MITTSDDHEKDAEEKATITVPCGVDGNLVYESIFYQGRPAFLVYDGKKFTVTPSLETATQILLPLTTDMQPYRPYDLQPRDIEKANKLRGYRPEELYKHVYKAFDTFCDIEEEYKVLEAHYCILTYVQHKIATTSYLFHHGEPASGKTRFLDLHNNLDYRPLFGPDLPAADIYSYIGEKEEGTTTIIEDEATNLHENSQKMKIYRSGYRKGATTPRIELGRDSGRKIRFFKTFCCKIFAGYEVPSDQAFAERCIAIHVIQGRPQKDEITIEDQQRFSILKKYLLLWRMVTYFDPLPAVETKLNGRLKELWKPLLQLSKLLSAYPTMQKFSEEIQARQTEQLSNSLEAKVVLTAVKECMRTDGLDAKFDDLWKRFIYEAEPTRTWPDSIVTQDFGEITKHRFASKLRSAAGIENRPRKIAKDKTQRVYIFDINKLLKAAEKYKLSDEYVTWLQNYGEDEADPEE